MSAFFSPSGLHSVEYDEAAKLYHSTSDRTPTSTEKCIQLLEKALERHPEDHDALHLLATCHSELDRKTKAVSLWEKSARLVDRYNFFFFSFHSFQIEHICHKAQLGSDNFVDIYCAGKS